MGGISCHLDRLLIERDMTLAELARQVGVTGVNLSILKNNRAKAIRFTTLIAICEARGVQPGDIFTLTGSETLHAPLNRHPPTRVAPNRGFPGSPSFSVRLPTCTQSGTHRM